MYVGGTCKEAIRFFDNFQVHSMGVILCNKVNYISVERLYMRTEKIRQNNRGITQNGKASLCVYHRRDEIIPNDIAGDPTGIYCPSSL